MTSKAIQSAIDNLVTVTKQAAREELLAELGGKGAPRAARKPRAVPKKRTAKRGAAKAKAPRAPRARASAEDLQAKSAELLEFIRINPAQSSEEIGKSLSLEPALLRKLMKPLLSEGKVTMAGKARGARYSVAGAAPAPASGEGAPNGAAKRTRAPRRVTTAEA